MSGSYSYDLAQLSTGAAVLNILLGSGSQSPALSGQTPVQALQQAEQNQTQDVKVTAAQPNVKAAINAFTAGVKSAKTVAQLLANPAVMNVLLTANGMSDQIGYTALATQALTSKLSDPKSLANQLTDTRWQTLAQSYNFAANGLKSIQTPAAIASVANAYATATWQTNEDTITPGLSNALAFKAQAASITSVDQILGNSTMRTVVTTTLGVPAEIAFQPLNAQEKAISSRVNIKDFQDPKYVESFIQRYLIANSAASTSSNGVPGDITSLAVQAGAISV